MSSRSHHTLLTKLIFKMDFWVFLSSDDPQFLVYFDCHTLQQQCMYPVCLFLYHQHCCISNSQLHLPSFLLTFPSEATGWNINTWIIQMYTNSLVNADFQKTQIYVLNANSFTYTYVKYKHTLESGIDVGQGINIGPGKFVKKNKCRALNKRRA